MQTITKTLILVLLLSLIGQGMATSAMSCDMHHDNQLQMQDMDHSAMLHHDMSNHPSDKQLSNDMVQHDCCNDESSCPMNSCVAISYLTVDSPQIDINSLSREFLNEKHKHSQQTLLSLYRPPILA